MRSDRRLCEERCETCEKELRRASVDVSRSHQRVQSLERLHDLAFAEWQRETDRVERRTMDELASLRFTRREERTAK